MSLPASLLPRTSTSTGRALLGAGTAALALGIPLILYARSRKTKTAGAQTMKERTKKSKYITELSEVQRNTGGLSRRVSYSSELNGTQVT